MDRLGCKWSTLLESRNLRTWFFMCAKQGFSYGCSASVRNSERPSNRSSSFLSSQITIDKVKRTAFQGCDCNLLSFCTLVPSLTRGNSTGVHSAYFEPFQPYIKRNPLCNLCKRGLALCRILGLCCKFCLWKDTCVRKCYNSRGCILVDTIPLWLSLTDQRAGR